MPLTYREVTGLWSARVPDGPDSDQYPDTVLLEGHVTFEPEYRVPLVYPGEHIVIEPLHAVIHEGVLYGETVVGDDVVRGPLFLPVTVDDAANQTWSWLARFQGMRLGEYGEEVALPNVRFQVPAGDDALDLSEVIPVSQSGNTITLRGPGLSEEDAQALVDAGLDARGLLPDGSLPSVARAEVEQIVTEAVPSVSGVPIFETLAEAQAWEAENPGRVALWVTGGVIPPDPDPDPDPGGDGVPSDFTWRWTGDTFTPEAWPDSTGKMTLEPVGATGDPAPVKVGTGVRFDTHYGMGATGAGLGPGPKTLVLVASVENVSTALQGIVGDPTGPHTIAIPGGGGAKAGYYSNDGSSIKATNIGGNSSVDSGMHVVTARIDGASSTLTHDRHTVAGSGASTVPFTTFQIGGSIHGLPMPGVLVQEVRVYNRRLSDQEVTDLTTHLGGLYGVAI